jgi:hypothetical protein
LETVDISAQSVYVLAGGSFLDSEEKMFNAHCDRFDFDRQVIGNAWLSQYPVDFRKQTRHHSAWIRITVGERSAGTIRLVH